MNKASRLPPVLAGVLIGISMVAAFLISASQSDWHKPANFLV